MNEHEKEIAKFIQATDEVDLYVEKKKSCSEAIFECLMEIYEDEKKYCP